MQRAIKAFAFVVFVVVVIALATPEKNLTASTASKSTTNSPTTTVAEPATPPPAPKPGAQWAYYRDEDEMGNGTISTASVYSTNTVEFSFPYSDPQHAHFTLRTHPRLGKNVIFSIERGQFLCPSYEGCSVLIRFDDQKAQTFSAVGPQSNSSDLIFIKNYSRFMGSMLKAKRVRIAANIYQEGQPVFDFDVSGFDAARYKPK